MKTIRFFIMVVLLSTFFNCNNDDDNNPAPTNEKTWSLTHVTGGLAGVDQTFPAGLITWTFNEDTQMLHVVNNNTDEMLQDFFDTGTYPYSIQIDNTTEILFINGIELGNMIETEHELSINQQYDDGFLLTLTR